ncbi:hypothetical protein QC761_0100500 [Podospora bellae-mahoneyi]|uniref:Uncharacterized protein n=1 Tax=Podospora bellae-mahoneyi TaxID=2093777 RepID=A0ABR0FBA5_9PEZI|nr:hypothetical protein QC761_0100500 [Podospora bellae-mahoneyi]
MRPKKAPATTNRLARPIWTPGQPGRRRTKLRLPRPVSERGREDRGAHAKRLGFGGRQDPRGQSPLNRGQLASQLQLLSTLLILPLPVAVSSFDVKLSIYLGVKVVVGSSGALHCVLLNKRA